MDYAFALDCVVDAFRVECRLPLEFVDKIKDEKQFYVELRELAYPLPSETRLTTTFAAQLMNMAEIIGKELAAIANENLSELHEISVPSGYEFASWRAPIRMIVDYHVWCGIRICRFDIVGKIK